MLFVFVSSMNTSVVCTVDISSIVHTQHTLLLYRWYGEIEECETLLGRAQYNLGCPGATSLQTDTYQGFFEDLDDACADRVGMCIYKLGN